MEVSKKFVIGNTRVKIATDYCKDKNDVDNILKIIAKNALHSFNVRG